MSIITWIILGLIAGFVGAKLVNRDGQGFWLDIALGIIGALVGGFLFSLFGASGVTGLNIYSMIVAIVGSIGGAADLQRRDRTIVGRSAPTKKSQRQLTGGEYGRSRRSRSDRLLQVAVSVSLCCLLCSPY